MKLILKTITCILLSWVLGCALLVFVFKIPVQEMKKNAQRSTAIYDYEGVYPQLISGYKFSQLDNSTDATMILGAIFPGTGDSLRDAMLVHHIGYVGRNPVGSLTDFANDVKAETYTAVYSRYWHGYLVILKILLLCFDIADIRMISLCCLWGMIFYIVLQLQKQGKGNYIIPFFSYITGVKSSGSSIVTPVFNSKLYRTDFRFIGLKKEGMEKARKNIFMPTYRHFNSLF